MNENFEVRMEPSASSSAGRISYRSSPIACSNLKSVNVPVRIGSSGPSAARANRPRQAKAAANASGSADRFTANVPALERAQVLALAVRPALLPAVRLALVSAAAHVPALSLAPAQEAPVAPRPASTCRC